MVYLEQMLFYCCLAAVFMRPIISQMAFSRLDTVLVIIFSIAATPIIAINRSKIKHNAIDFFILLFILALAFSFLSSSDAQTSLSRSSIVLSYFLIFYLTRCLENAHKEKLLKTIIFSAMLICGYGVYQYFWGFRHVTESLIRNRIYYPFAYEWLSRKRVFSTFFTPNAFAGFLIMALPLTFSIKHYQRDIKDTSKFILFALVLLTINLLLAQSISAILSFVLSICLILSMKNPKKNYLFISIILGLLVVAVIFYLRNKTGRAFITPLFSWEKRIAYYKEALWMIKQHPLWGIGWGNFVGKDSLFVHNSYLQIWIELGILGIFSLGGIIFTTIRSAFQRIAAEPEAKSYLLPLFCAFLAFAIHNLIDFTFYLPEVTWLWWIVIAIIIS